MPLPNVTTLVGGGARPSPNLFNRVPVAPTIPPPPAQSQQTATPQPTQAHAPAVQPQTHSIQPTPQSAPEPILQTTAVAEFDPSMFAIALDPIFQTSLESAQLQDVSSSVPYIGFITEKSRGKYPDLNEGDIYLSYEGQTVKINRTKLFLMDAQVYYTKCASSDYAVQFAREHMTEEELKLDNTWQKHAVGIAIVIIDGRPIPAKLDFGRSTRTQAAQRAMNAVSLSKEPGWSEKSDRHRIAAQAPLIWTRVVHTFTPFQNTGKDGMISYPLNSTSEPATLTDLRIIWSALAQPEFRSEVSTVAEAALERVQAIVSKIRR